NELERKPARDPNNLTIFEHHIGLDHHFRQAVEEPNNFITPPSNDQQLRQALEVVSDRIGERLIVTFAIENSDDRSSRALDHRVCGLVEIIAEFIPVAVGHGWSSLVLPSHHS